MPENLTVSMQDNVDALLPLLVEHGLSVIGAVLLLIVGLWLSGRARVWTVRALGKARALDDMLRGFFGSIARYLVLIVVVLAVLSQFGIETTSLIAVLGTAALAIGLALQGTLSNIAAGVMLLIFRPFKIGDFVEIDGIAGTVKELTLFTTELATPDNVQIIVPNSGVWGQPLKNYSAHATRRVDFTFGISYSDDIDKAFDVIRAVVVADTRTHASPEALIVVGNLGDSSVDIVVRVWTDSGDYWGVKFDITKQVKEALDASGISIPFPTRTIYQAAP